MADQPTRQPAYYEYPDDEISLYELWNILVRRRLIVAVVFVLVLVTATGYALTRTPMYLMDAVIQIGKMPAFAYMELEESARPDVTTHIAEPGATVQMLNETVIPRVLSEKEESSQSADNAMPAIHANVVDQSAGLIRLSTELPAEWEEPARAALDQISQSIISAHRAHLENAESTLSESKAAAFGEIASLNAQLSRIEARQSEIKSDVSSESASALEMLADQMAMQNGLKSYERISYLRSQLRRFEAMETNTEATQVTRAPKLSDEPQGRSPELLIALGAVLGLMLGVFAAFGREFLANAAAARDTD